MQLLRAWSDELCLGVVAGVLVSATGCASTVPRDSLQQAPRSGFVRDIDEPSSRGQLSQVSPEDLNVYGRFAIAKDGTWIAFSARKADADMAEPYELYKIAVSGSAPVKLTSGSEQSVLYPSISDDGEYIYYNTGGSHWRIRSDGSGARTKIQGSGLEDDCCGQVSSQGRMVFTSLEYATRSAVSAFVVPAEITSLIWAVTATGGELTQFRQGRFPVWSPDGKLVAFEHQGDIWLMGGDGRNLTQLTNTPKIAEGLPCFSPDGKQVAYTSDEKPSGTGGGDPNIWFLGIDGASKSQVTGLVSWDSWPCWGKEGLFFLSARGSKDKKVQRIWKLTLE